MNFSLLIALATNWVAVLRTPVATNEFGTRGTLEAGFVRTNLHVVDTLTETVIGKVGLPGIGGVMLRTNWGTNPEPALVLYPGRLDKSGVYQLSNSPLRLLVGNPPRTTNVHAFTVSIQPRAPQ
jgi:hypothetical protein